jgi:hypothetical protein
MKNLFKLLFVVLVVSAMLFCWFHTDVFAAVHRHQMAQTAEHQRAQATAALFTPQITTLQYGDFIARKGGWLMVHHASQRELVLEDVPRGDSMSVSPKNIAEETIRVVRRTDGDAAYNEAARQFLFGEKPH